MKDVTYKNGKAYVEFERIPGGIGPFGTELKAFEIAGEDRTFYPAKAMIVKKTHTVEVSSDKVKKPVAVRYAFRNYVEVNLFNAMGVSPISFRTDDWEVKY